MKPPRLIATALCSQHHVYRKEQEIRHREGGGLGSERQPLAKEPVMCFFIPSGSRALMGQACLPL